MNTTVWIFQGLIAFVFLFSGANKAYFDEETLVRKGQTGVQGLSSWLITFIGILEIFGAIALVVPMIVNRWTILTPIASIGLGLIMIPAAYIHKKRNEPRNVIINMAILVVCCLIASYRMNFIA